MLSPSVRMLLERAIDTPLKLHCVMLFAQRTITSGTTAQVASRLCRDHWSTQQTLDELAEAGILLTLPRQGDTVYEYRPVRYLTDALSLLLEMYNDPVRRDELYNEVRELALYAPYRAHFTRVVAI
jgi:hypothetical protein